MEDARAGMLGTGGSFRDLAIVGASGNSIGQRCLPALIVIGGNEMSDYRRPLIIRFHDASIGVIARLRNGPAKVPRSRGARGKTSETVRRR